MATTKPLADAITALTAYANSVTDASDTTLSDAVRSLAGGYGGGDFSIANVTISLKNMSNLKGGYITFTFPNISNNAFKMEGSVGNNAVSGEVTSVTFAVVLYKGRYDKAGFTTSGLNVAGMPEFTGGCAMSQDGTHVEITGDGTITIPVLANS